jgi:hypothetical protein
MGLSEKYPPEILISGYEPIEKGASVNIIIT